MSPASSSVSTTSELPANDDATKRIERPKFETALMLEILAERLPTLRLVEQEFDYFPNITFRGPSALHVAWD